MGVMGVMMMVGTAGEGTRPATGRAGSDRASTVLVTIRCHGLGLLLFSRGRQRISENIFQKMGNARQSDLKLLIIKD